MGLFWNRKEPRTGEVAELRAELAALRKEFHTLRDEVQEDMERAYRHRKAVEAQARRDAKEAAGAPGRAPSPGGAVEGSALPPSLWGAKRRRLLRSLRPPMNGTEEEE